MYSKWQWLLIQFGRRLWVRVALMTLLGVVTALVAIFLERFLPEKLPTQVGAEAVDGILHILASSMLSVTTFSLSIMVAAYGSATSNVTPRATKLLMEDSTTQNVLATFIGSFLYSLVGIITLSTGAYGERGRLVLLAVTIVVIVLIVVALLRWIEHLSRLGRVSTTTDRVEEATAAALRWWIKNPSLGGQRILGEQPSTADSIPIFADRVGYVQHIDLPSLASLIDATDVELFLQVIPGAFVHPARELLRIRGGELKRDQVLSAFTIQQERTYDQDPRFGLSVLAEIASRALSPALNDPGTAIDVIGRGVRLLAMWSEPRNSPSDEEIRYGRIWVPTLRTSDLCDDLFRPIIRDGASCFEVQIRLQKALAALSQLGSEDLRQHVRHLSRLALQRNVQGSMLDEELQQLRAAAISQP